MFRLTTNLTRGKVIRETQKRFFSKKRDIPSQETLFKAIETQPLSEVQVLYTHLHRAQNLLVRPTNNKYDRNRGNNALHSAFEFGKHDTAKWLIKECPGLLVKKNAIEVTPGVNLLIYFHKSFNGSQHRDLVKTVLSSSEFEESFYKSSNLTTAKEYYKFICALHLEDNNDGAFRILEKNTGSLYWQDPFGFTPLHYIVARDRPEDLELYFDLVSAVKAPIRELLKIPDINGNNPLHIAVPNARTEKTKTVEKLLTTFSNNANNSAVDVLNYIEQPNNYGYDPFKIAISIGQRATLKILFKYGYNIKKPTYVVMPESIQKGQKEVRREPVLLTALLWLHEDEVVYKNVEWLFRHGVSIYDCFSKEEVRALDRGKIIKDVDSLFVDEPTVNLGQIATQLGFKSSASFLKSNGVISKEEIPPSTNEPNKLTSFVLNYCLNSSKGTFSSSQLTARAPFLTEELKSFIEQHKNLYNDLDFYKDFYKALVLTIFRGNFEIFRTLVDFYPELVFHSETSLITISYGNRSKGEPIKVTALHLAIMYGNNSYSNETIRQRFDRNKIISYLLDPNDSNVPVSFVRRQDHAGRTAFCVAAKYGCLEAIRLITQFYEKSNLTEPEKRAWVKELEEAEKIAGDHNRLDVLRYIDSKLRGNTSKELPPRKTSLVFQGGGVRGIAYAGALRELYGDGYIHQVITTDKKVLDYDNLSRGYYLKAKNLENIEVVVVHKKGHEATREIIELNLNDENFGKTTQKGTTIRKEIEEVLSKPRSHEAIKFIDEFSVLISSYCKHNLYHVGRVGGASAGAITALLVAFGYSPLEIEEIVKEQNFVDLLDKVRANGIDLNEAQEIRKKVEKEVEEFYKKRSWGSYIWNAIMGSTIFNAFYIFRRLKIGWEDKGLFKGDNLREELEKHIQKKVKIKNCTFRELHLLTLADPRFKDLYVVALDVKNQRTQVFSYEHTPDAIISDAVRCSMSIPGVFVPHSLYVKRADDRCLDVSKGKSVFVDGGIFDNYPMFLFHADSTLGFRLLEPKLWEKYMLGKDIVEKIRNLEQSSEYFMTLLSGILSKQESDFGNRPEDGHNVLINTKDIGFIHFNITEDQKQKLFNSGQHASSHYITSTTRPLLFMSHEVIMTSSKNKKASKEEKKAPTRQVKPK